MSQLQKFGTYTADAAAKARKEESSSSWLKLSPGTNIIRLLPPLVGMIEPWVTIYQHFIKLPGEGNRLVFNCPRRMNNERCPSCEKGDRLRATGRPADEKAAREWFPSQRNIAFAIDREDPEKGIQILGFGATIKNRLRHFREKLKKDITSFDKGFDIVIERMGQGLNTEYQVDLGEQCPILDNMTQLEEWAADLPDLQDFAKVLPYETIIEKFAAANGVEPPAGPKQVGGTVQDDDNELDDSETPY